MARVFTLDFVFNGQIYQSIIRLGEQNGEPVTHVRIFDPHLISILGMDSTEFAGVSGFRSIQFKHHLALPLLESIRDAIVQHLNKAK